MHPPQQTLPPLPPSPIPSSLFDCMTMPPRGLIRPAVMHIEGLAYSPPFPPPFQQLRRALLPCHGGAAPTASATLASSLQDVEEASEVDKLWERSAASGHASNKELVACTHIFELVVLYAHVHAIS